MSVGDTVTIQCPAGGAPPPHVLLIRNGRKLGTLTGTGYQIIVSLSDVGDYYCSASSIHVNPPYLKRRLTVNKKVTIKRAGKSLPNPLCVCVCDDRVYPSISCSVSEHYPPTVSCGKPVIE